MKALNEVLDEGLPLHPLEEQRESVRQWRQIGLGIMGLADALIKLGLTYGEEEAVAMCHRIGFAMADTAIAASALLAKEEGAYPMCNIRQVMETPYFPGQYHREDQRTGEKVRAEKLPAPDYSANRDSFYHAGDLRGDRAYLRQLLYAKDRIPPWHRCIL